MSPLKGGLSIKAPLLSCQVRTNANISFSSCGVASALINFISLTMVFVRLHVPDMFGKKIIIKKTDLKSFPHIFQALPPILCWAALLCFILCQAQFIIFSIFHVWTQFQLFLSNHFPHPTVLLWPFPFGSSSGLCFLIPVIDFPWASFLVALNISPGACKESICKNLTLLAVPFVSFLTIPLFLYHFFIEIEWLFHPLLPLEGCGVEFLCDLSCRGSPRGQLWIKPSNWWFFCFYFIIIINYLLYFLFSFLFLLTDVIYEYNE